MDKKKLLGTIIGVIMFALLIVGATFAWLTIAANVTNGTYSNLSTKNFIITYKGGTQITNTVQTSNPTKANITTTSTADGATNDGWLAVTASKTANSAPASDFTIKLHINSNTLTTKALTYAVCKGACPADVKLATVGSSTSCGSGVVACGSIAANQSNKDIELYKDTATFNTAAAVSTTTYNVYFWLDSATIQAADMGKTFSGYIHASATQGN